MMNHTIKTSGVVENMNTLNNYKSTIQAASVALLRDHGVTQNTIFGWVREAFKEHVKSLPKTRVLYNTCYGGYGFSEEFMMFRSKKQLVGGVFGGETGDTEGITHDHNEYRIEAVQDIVPFARSILTREDMKTLQSVLYMYHKYNFKTLFASVYKYRNSIQQQTNYVNNIAALEQYLRDPDSTYKILNLKDGDEYYPPERVYLIWSNPRFQDYTYESLQDLLHTCTHDNGEYLAKLKAEENHHREKVVAGIGEEGFHSIVEFIGNANNLSSRLSKQRHKQQLKNTEYRTKKSFIHNLFTLGYTDPCVWLFHQESYDGNAILYLIEKYTTYSDHMFDYISNTMIDMPEDVVHVEPWCQFYEKFGLLCASSAYANLACAEIPSLVEWEVDEYDGKERVYVL